jgi:hypothetical protein
VERVGAVLRDLGQGSAVSRRLAEAEALARWGDVVGSQLASRTVPITVSGGRLLVVVRGSALRQELSYQRVAILRKFNATAGQRVAREIVFLEGDPERLRNQVESCGRVMLPDAQERRAGAEDESFAAGDEENDEESTAGGGMPSECGLAFRPLDAAAYRRHLEKIARGADSGEAD